MAVLLYGVFGAYMPTIPEWTFPYKVTKHHVKRVKPWPIISPILIVVVITRKSLLPEFYQAPHYRAALVVRFLPLAKDGSRPIAAAAQR